MSAGKAALLQPNVWSVKVSMCLQVLVAAVLTLALFLLACMVRAHRTCAAKAAGECKWVSRRVSLTKSQLYAEPTVGIQGWRAASGEVGIMHGGKEKGRKSTTHMT